VNNRCSIKLWICDCYLTSTYQKMYLKSSLQFDNKGRTAEVDYNTHIHNLIEHLLFTAQGERVNRPTFGSGLLQMVFQGNSSELAATTQYLVQASLNQWLGNLIEVNQVRIRNEDARLEVDVAYTILKDREQRVAQFTR
ncbi:MAG: GPW/gp25 family protein, partial [Bacteroidota bacterium]